MEICVQKTKQCHIKSYHVAVQTKVRVGRGKEFSLLPSNEK